MSTITSTCQRLALVLLTAMLLLAPRPAAAQDNDTAVATVTAERLLRALQAHDRDSVRSVLPPQHRDEFDEEGTWAIFTGLKVHDWTIATTMSVGEGRAEVLVVWTVDFDLNAAVDALTTHARAVFAASGMSDEEVDAEIEKRADRIRKEAEQAGAILANEQIRIELSTDDDGNWWVDDIESATAHDQPSPADPAEAHEEAEWTVRLFLRAVQTHNDDRIEALVDPERREYFANQGTLVLLQSLTVHTFEIDGCQASPDSGDVIVTVRWSAELDAERYVELATAVVREFLSGQGMSDAQVEEAAGSARESFVARAAQLAGEVSQPHAATLVQHLGCWYVSDFTPAPDAPDATESGAATLEDAFLGAMEAMSGDNPDTIVPLLVPEARADYTERNFAEALRSIHLTDYEMVSVEETDEGWFEVIYTCTATVDSERMVAWLLAVQLQMLRDDGASEEDIAQLREQMLEVNRAGVADLAARFASGRQRMRLQEVDGRFYVDEPYSTEPLDGEDGGDDDDSDGDDDDD